MQQVDSWTYKTVGELCRFTSGHGFGPNDWSDSGLAIIRIQNLNGGDSFNYFSGVPDPKWIVEPGDLLFAWAGVQGVSFGATRWRGTRGVLNQHIYKVQAAGEVDLDWIELVLHEVTARVERNAHGFKSNLVHVRKADITDQLVPIPPPAERRGILALHGLASDYLNLVDDLADACRDHLRGLMQQLLTGRRRLPAFAGETWEPTRFGDFLSESREPGSGGDTARKLTVKLYGKGVTPKRETKSGSNQTQYYRRSAGQFIYSKLDFLNGAFGIVPQNLDGYESTLDLPAFDVSPTADTRWLLHFCTRESFYRKYAKFANGGRKARRVNPADFFKIEEPIPSLDEQRAIADILDTAQHEIELLEQLREQIQLQKRGLMQKLLTGEIRVPAEANA